MLENSEEEVSNFFAIFVIAGGDPFSMSFEMHFFCSHNSPKIKRKKTISTVEYSIKTIHKSCMHLYVLNYYALLNFVFVHSRCKFKGFKGSLHLKIQWDAPISKLSFRILFLKPAYAWLQKEHFNKFFVFLTWTTLLDEDSQVSAWRIEGTKGLKVVTHDNFYGPSLLAYNNGTYKESGCMHAGPSALIGG